MVGLEEATNEVRGHFLRSPGCHRPRLRLNFARLGRPPPPLTAVAAKSTAAASARAMCSKV